MEHIIQFGVCIDEQKIIDSAIEMAGRKIIDHVGEKIDEYARRRWSEPSKLEELFAEEIRKLIELYKDEIINATIESTTGRLMRSKLMRDAIAKVGEDDLK